MDLDSLQAERDTAHSLNYSMPVVHVFGQCRNCYIIHSSYQRRRRLNTSPSCDRDRPLLVIDGLLLAVQLCKISEQRSLIYKYERSFFN